VNFSKFLNQLDFKKNFSDKITNKNSRRTQKKTSNDFKRVYLKSNTIKFNYIILNIDYRDDKKVS
jgi:hypothetical protein